MKELRPKLAAISQPRIDRFAFHREHSEDAFVNFAERFVADEAFERFDSEGELTQCERAFGVQAT